MTRVVIIDDHVKEYQPLVVRLRERYQVDIFSDPEEGLQSIEDNINSKQIVILDIDLGEGVMTGHRVLERLRDVSFLIPVIIWSAKDETNETFADLINNKTFAFVPQVEEEMLIEKVDSALNELNSNVDVALETWLVSQPDKDKPYLITSNGKEYSISDIITEIRNRTEFGVKMEKDITMLAIDLLTRKKRELNG